METPISTTEEYSISPELENVTTTTLNPYLPPPVPDYVCCVVTEGVWTWFAAFLLIIVLFSAATLKYCRKRLSKPKFIEKNRNLLLQYILEDDKGKKK